MALELAVARGAARRSGRWSAMTAGSASDRSTSASSRSRSARRSSMLTGLALGGGPRQSPGIGDDLGRVGEGGGEAAGDGVGVALGDDEHQAGLGVEGERGRRRPAGTRSRSTPTEQATTTGAPSASAPTAIGGADVLHAVARGSVGLDRRAASAAPTSAGVGHDAPRAASARAARRCERVGRGVGRRRCGDAVDHRRRAPRRWAGRRGPWRRPRGRGGRRRPRRGRRPRRRPRPGRPRGRGPRPGSRRARRRPRRRRRAAAPISSRATGGGRRARGTAPASTGARARPSARHTAGEPAKAVARRASRPAASGSSTSTWSWSTPCTVAPGQRAAEPPLGSLVEQDPAGRCRRARWHRRGTCLAAARHRPRRDRCPGGRRPGRAPWRRAAASAARDRERRQTLRGG